MNYRRGHALDTPVVAFRHRHHLSIQLPIKRSHPAASMPQLALLLPLLQYHIFRILFFSCLKKLDTSILPSLPRAS